MQETSRSKKKGLKLSKLPGLRPSYLERVMGLEPTIFCLGSKRSTTELHPLGLARILIGVAFPVNPN